MDFKEKVNELVEKIKSDPKLLADLQSEPVKAVEKLLGVDLPDDVVQKLIDGIKAKLTAEKLAGGLNALKKIF